MATTAKALLKQPVCKVCGTQYPSGESLPELCTICNDDRQYITEQGQLWLEIDELKKQYSTKITKITDQLYSLKISPDFGIGQRTFLVLSPHGNILWDCIPLLDEATTAFIKSKGGLKAVAFSHPHYYSNMNAWAETFSCPVFIHERDAQWIMYQSKNIQLWKGHSLKVSGDISIVHTAGHFPGSCVLRIPDFSKDGVILSGDSLFVSRSKRHIAVMYSYPNQILLSKTEFLSVYENTRSLVFDTMYGAFEGQNIIGNAKEVFDSSMKRYLESYGVLHMHD